MNFLIYSSWYSFSTSTRESYMSLISIQKPDWNVVSRAGEPANFFSAPAPAPAPDFFFKRLRLRLQKKLLKYKVRWSNENLNSTTFIQIDSRPVTAVSFMRGRRSENYAGGNTIFNNNLLKENLHKKFAGVPKFWAKAPFFFTGHRQHRYKLITAQVR